MGQCQDALSFYAQALEARRAASDRKGEAITLHNMATTYATLGEWESARRVYEQALQVERENDDPMG